MQTHETSSFQPAASSLKNNLPAPRPFEDYTGQELDSHSNNPFPPRPHEVWMGEPRAGSTNPFPRRRHEVDMGEPTVARKPVSPPVQAEGNPEPEVSPYIFGNRSFRMNAPDAPPPPPRRWGLQAKLAIGQPNDVYEQEADRVAEQVMGMSPATPAVQRQAEEEEPEELQTKPLSETITPLVQRQADLEEDEPIQAKCEDCETEDPIQRFADSPAQAQPDLEDRLNASQGGGSPLSEEVRSFMEPRFGADFSQVRVHTGSEAVQMNRDLNAQAFTHKQDVYFGAGKAPARDALTAHELTHVMQQLSGFANVSALQMGPPAPSSASGTQTPSVIGLANQLTNVSANLVHAGAIDAVTAQPEGNNVRLTAPGVSYTGRASLVKGLKLGADSIQVGIIQTVVSSERIGVYRRNGDPKGEVLTERRFSMSNVPDKGGQHAFSPFYHPPETLDDAHPNVFIVAEDQPHQDFPVAVNEGKLTQTRGADRFTGSLAAKRGEELVHLKNFAWEVPWSLILDKNQRGTGSGVTTGSTNAPPRVPGGDVANVVGNNPENTINAYTSDAAADAALRDNKINFLNDLSRHKAKAPDSYWKMVGALWRSPMNFVVKVTVINTASLVGRDTISVIGNAHTSANQTLKIAKGASDEANLLAHTVYDPNKLDALTKITLLINGQSISWSFPYSSISQTIKSGGGEYNIQGFLR